MALKVDGGTRCRGGDDGDETGADGLADGDSEMQREERREQNAAANASERAQQSGERSPAAQGARSAYRVYETTRGSRCGFCLLVRVIARAHHGAGLNVAETEAQCRVA